MEKFQPFAGLYRFTVYRLSNLRKTIIQNEEVSYVSVQELVWKRHKHSVLVLFSKWSNKIEDVTLKKNITNECVPTLLEASKASMAIWKNPVINLEIVNLYAYLILSQNYQSLNPQLELWTAIEIKQGNAFHMPHDIWLFSYRC